ncbi:MAG: site-specific integrase [Candidatus Thermoplasmatota archaeon]
MHRIIPFGETQLKKISELPPHISYEEFNLMLKAVDSFYAAKNKTKHRNFMRDRDKLFLSLLWETGGRVSDVCALSIKDFDFKNRILNLYMKKRRRVNKITLGDRCMYEVSEYLRNYHQEDKLFDISRIRAWKLIKRYAEIAGIEDVHPHKFRHGLAIYLLQQGVPIPVISARLGHSSVYITMQLYMKVTPEIQRRFLERVPMRED